jgi:hexosaminidase
MEYRGFMLDVARTFVPKERVMRLVDNIAHHKINKFHWHLADDEGWRVEIKSHPELAETGGFRGGDSPVFPVYGEWDSKYGGYYTQDEIRQVVAYAAVRGVEVIPELDLPGHSRTAARVHPEILCDYRPSMEASAGYDTRNVWCVAREENYAMLDDIIGELAQLFPSETIMLGGDEVSSSQWGKCPHCKALMASRGISEPARLQDVFMSRVADIASRHGKKTGVWNEAVEGETMARTTTVWAWEGIAQARRAAAAGYPTVVCAGKYFYFDMRQSQGEVGHIWAGIVSPETVYGFGLAAAGFTPTEAANVRGVEATFFAELLLENGLDFLDYQLFPRVCALAEVGWTPASARDWNDFERRLSGGAGTSNGAGGSGSAESHFARLKAMGIKYRGSGAANFDRNEPPAAALKKPAVTFTSSMRESGRTPFSRVATYKGSAYTTTACTEGDWLLWRFAAPVTASRIDIKTGYDHLQRAGFPIGRVEVSYDGSTFESVARLHDLKATIRPQRPVRAIRVVSESHGNGESFTIIQPLKIR